MNINELIKISIIGLKENYNMTDVHRVVKAIKEKVSEDVITKEVAFAMLEEISKRSNPEVKMKHILNAWETEPRLKDLELASKKIQRIKEESEKGFKNQDTYKAQKKELESLNNTLIYYMSLHKLTYADKNRIIDEYINNTETLHLSNMELLGIYRDGRRLAVKFPNV